MKKTLLLTSFILLKLHANAQSLTFEQLQKTFKKWVTTKGIFIKPITTQLKSINSKWQLKSSTPTTDGEVKYYLWTAVGSKSDTSLIALSIEEDESKIQYGLKYGFNSVVSYNCLKASLESSSYYKGNVVSFNDNGNGQFTITGRPPEVGPLSSRFDCVLTEYSSNPRIFTFDLRSRYIQ